MKICKYIAAALLLTLCGACNKDKEAFYTTTYPVVRIEAQATVTATAPEEGEEPVENPIVAQITGDVEAQAPVKAGGSYTLHFFEYYGGPLTVHPSAEGTAIQGAFSKTPGQTDLRFTFEEGETLYGYVCAVSSYASEEGESRILFTVDLTDYYKALYPEEPITKVLRKEYTSHPAK